MKNLLLAGALLGLLWLLLRRRNDSSSDGGVFFPSLPGGEMSLSDMASVKSWADAIQSFEGWQPGSRSYRNNNPGNIRGKGDAGSDKDGFAVFSSYDAGRAALESDLAAKVRKYPSWSLLQIMGRYAPASDGNAPVKYANYIAGRLGVGVSNTLSEIFG